MRRVFEKTDLNIDKMKKKKLKGMNVFKKMDKEKGGGVIRKRVNKRKKKEK